jgi:hypothetical protein
MNVNNMPAEQLVEFGNNMVALSDAMEAERAKIADEVVIDQCGPHMNGVALITRHGEHQSKIIKSDCNLTVAVVRDLLTCAVATHARRMPKHQEFAALVNEAAA